MHSSVRRIIEAQSSFFKEECDCFAPYAVIMAGFEAEIS